MTDEINNLGSVRAWLFGCPAVAENATHFGADFLGSNPDCFALVSVSSILKNKENIIGETRPEHVQRQNLAIDYRAAFGEQAERNLKNLALFQSLHDWIMAQNNTGNFPAWHGGTIKSIVPTITPTMMDALDASARYRIQICVTYEID